MPKRAKSKAENWRRQAQEAPQTSAKQTDRFGRTQQQQATRAQLLMPLVQLQFAASSSPASCRQTRPTLFGQNVNRIAFATLKVGPLCGLFGAAAFAASGRQERGKFSRHDTLVSSCPAPTNESPLQTHTQTLIEFVCEALGARSPKTHSLASWRLASLGGHLVAPMKRKATSARRRINKWPRPNLFSSATHWRPPAPSGGALLCILKHSHAPRTLQGRSKVRPPPTYCSVPC